MLGCGPTSLDKDGPSEHDGSLDTNDLETDTSASGCDDTDTNSGRDDTDTGRGDTADTGLHAPDEVLPGFDVELSTFWFIEEGVDRPSGMLVLYSASADATFSLFVSLIVDVGSVPSAGVEAELEFPVTIEFEWGSSAYLTVASGVDMEGCLCTDAPTCDIETIYYGVSGTFTLHLSDHNTGYFVLTDVLTEEFTITDSILIDSYTSPEIEFDSCFYI